MTMNATYSPDDNKLRLYSSRRLDAETYARVKAAGFRWAPRQDLFFTPTWSPGAEDLLIELCGEIGDEDTSLCARAEQRADRFEDYSDKRGAEAVRARDAVDQIAERFHGGQPILVGHHSEKSARRDKERMDSGMRKAIRLWDTSQYWTARAAGALAHAKHKELPAVRHRRIKTIEADKRKVEREQDKTARELKAWQIVAGINDPEKQRSAGLAVANGGGYWSMSFPLPDYPRDPPASQYEGPMGLWSAIDGNVITAAQAAAIAVAGMERSIPRRARWIAHYDNRLAYERAMLAEQIGGEATANPLADRFAFAVGGSVQVRRSDEWLTVLKVNRGANGSVSSLTTATAAGRKAHWRVESVREYRAPSAENVAAAKAAAKLPPLCNYPGEGFVSMTKAEYDAVPKDYRGHNTRKPTDAAGAHRIKCAIGAFASKGDSDPNKRHRYLPVFITDAKRVDPPAPIPPAEPTDAAEFVAACVATPSSAAKAELPRAPQPVANPASTDAAAVAPVAPAPAPLPDTTDSAAPSAAADFEAMRATLKGGGVAVVVAPHLFPTPAELAREVVRVAEVMPGQRVLEPNAGTGAILQPVFGAFAGADGGRVVAVEINARLAESLRHDRNLRAGANESNFDIRCADFLECTAEELGTFHRVVMNPPFERGADIKHIEHARRFLKPGGRLVAICADGPRQRERLQPLASTYRPLPPGTFKSAGTMVNTALVVIDAPTVTA